MPKKQCFTLILKSGATYEGCIHYYHGKPNNEALKIKIIEKMMLDYGVKDSDIVNIYLG